MLLDKKPSDSFFVLLDRSRALSFIMYNEVCPLFCIEVAWECL
jgi:hypothetical protein